MQSGEIARIRPWPLRHPRWLLFVVSIVTTLPLCFARDLWGTDEPRYAQVAREIRSGGDWVVLHLNGEPYLEKPPLYFWAEALVAELAGDVEPWVARLPAVLAAALALLLCHDIGRRLLSERIALLGSLVLASTINWWWAAQHCGLDVMLAAWGLLAVWCEVRASAAAPPRDAWWRLGFFAACALATLTKGPVGLVVPLLFRVARACVRRDARDFLRGPWLRGILVYAVIVGAWFVPWMLRLGSTAVLAELHHQTAGRIAHSFAHAKPWWYYGVSLPQDLLPWSLLGLVLLLVAWRSARRRSRPPPDAAASWPAGTAWLAAFALLVLLFFSCVSGKRSSYLLPVFPALALLFAAAVERRFGRDERFARSALLVALGAALLLGVTGMTILPGIDAWPAIGPFTLESPSVRAVGRCVRAEVDAGHHVVLVDVQHPDAVLYFARLDQLPSTDLPPAEVARSWNAQAGAADELRLLVERDRSCRKKACFPGFVTAAEVAGDGRRFVLLAPEGPRQDSPAR